MKACLGIAWGNQTIGHHLTSCFIFLIKSQVFELTKTPFQDIVHTGLSSSPSWIFGSLLWISTKSSDLAGFQHHWSPFLKTEFTLASKLLCESYTILTCTSHIRGQNDVNCQAIDELVYQYPTFSSQLHEQFWGRLICQKLLPFSI